MHQCRINQFHPEYKYLQSLAARPATRLALTVSFIDKELLYPDYKFRMPEEVLENYIRQAIESHRSNQVTIAWQGGEPTLMGIAGEPDIKENLFKVHIDGYNILPYLLGEADESPRNWFFYANDGQVIKYKKGIGREPVL
jgi:hypothetical protein